jgi:hypothetical protein
MSWTISRNEENSENLRDLKAAIDDAHRENILMFCAVSDQGRKAYHESYPGICGHIFRIGAATEAENFWERVEGPEVDFLFPGENVMVEAMDSISLPNSKSLSGSSLATALAAGLAAQILYCVKIIAPESLIRVGSYDGMNRVLHRLCRGGSRFPQVFTLFNIEFGDLPREGTRKLQDIVLKLLNL